MRLGGCYAVQPQAHCTPPLRELHLKAEERILSEEHWGDVRPLFFFFLKFYFVLQVSKKRAKEKSNRVQVWGDGLVSSRIEVV